MLNDGFERLERSAIEAGERVAEAFRKDFNETRVPADKAGGEANVIATSGCRPPRQKSRRSGGAQPGATSPLAPNPPAPRAPLSRRKVAKPQAEKRLTPRSNVPAAPIHELPQAIAVAKSTSRAPAATQIPEAKHIAEPTGFPPPETPSATGGADEGQVRTVDQSMSALVGEIIEVHRRYEDLRRAHQRLLLQGMAVCRGYAGGDKVAGAKLYNDPTPKVAAWLLPYEAAMEPITAAIKEQEKVLEKLGKKLPVADWAGGVSGLSTRFLAMIVGESGRGPGEYRSPACLWKRMGTAVVSGERQRRVSGAAALEHGYVPRRRSLMWNIGNSVLKQQTRNPKDENNKPTGERYATGPYGEIYIERRAHEEAMNERGENAELAADLVTRAKKEGSAPNKHNLEGKLSPGHIHNRAKRYIEKRLLRELWRAWRRATGPLAPIFRAPASEIQGESDGG